MGQLTTERTIIMVHGLHYNREALDGGLLNSERSISP